jgi:FkbM family methyltransferase
MRNPFHYAAAPPRLFDSRVFRELAGDRRFTILDGGAANELFDPFAALDHHIQIVAFEPNPEARRYTARVPVTFVEHALWHREEPITLHVAQEPSTSSIYPPNTRLLRMFNDRIGEPARRTVRHVAVPGLSIDAAVARGLCPSPDFIKLDIHSAEFEALAGAEGSLERCTGVLVETWHNPIHAGQHLHGDVESFLNARGFHLFDLRFASNWKHCVDGHELRSDRAQLVGSESLFFRDDPPGGAELFAIACADLFRYANFALQLARRCGATGALEADAASRIASEMQRIISERERRKPAYLAARWTYRVAKAVLGRD